MSLVKNVYKDEASNHNSFLISLTNRGKKKYNFEDDGFFFVTIIILSFWCLLSRMKSGKRSPLFNLALFFFLSHSR